MIGSNNEEAKQSHKYINDFLYFVIKPYQPGGKGALVYCSGVNLGRFLPITKGRHGLASNPALRGLQLVNHDVRSLALSSGATPKAIRGNYCAGIAPTTDMWYTELLLIENANDSFPAEVINYGVINLLKKIIQACMLQGVSLPDTLPKPDELEVFIEDLCHTYAN